jgi:hypothetical protein
MRADLAGVASHNWQASSKEPKGIEMRSESAGPSKALAKLDFKLLLLQGTIS